MVRIIVRTQDCSAVANGVENSAAEVSFKTFEIDAPALEAHLKQTFAYVSREIIGGELITVET